MNTKNTKKETKTTITNKNAKYKNGELLDNYNRFRTNNKELYKDMYNTLNFINLYNLHKNNTLELSSIDKLSVTSEDIGKIKDFTKKLLKPTTYQKLVDTSNTNIKEIMLGAMVGATKISRKDVSSRKDAYHEYRTQSTISVFEFFRCLEKQLVVSVRVQK